MKYKSVVWDWNGTLLDDVETGVRTLADMLERRGLRPLSLEEYKESFGFPVIDFYRATGFDLEKESLHALSVDFVRTYDRYAGRLELNEGVEGVLEEIKGMGIRQYVLSALREDLLVGMLDAFGISSYFSGVCGSDNIYAAGKVDRGRRMLSTYGLEPGSTLMVGDTLHDAEVARKLGFDCILYSGGHNSGRRLKEKAAVLGLLEDLPAHLL